MPAGFEDDPAVPAAPSEGGSRRSLAVPPELPGSEEQPFQLPPFDANQPPEERQEAIRQVYEALPELPAEQVIAPGTADRPLSLMDLQHTAFSRSPAIMTAWAAVDAARGRAVQAGLCPNPVVGYQGDTINTLDTAGYNGAFVEQTYVTAGKLCLAQQRALMEVRAAEYAYRRARFEVAAEVRRGYFGVLIAQERIRLMRAMAQLTQDAYEVQVDLVGGGQAAAYEPLQLRVIALQARNAVVTAENAYLGSWRELAAALSYADMHPVELAGSIEFPPPVMEFDPAKAALLSRHTDLSIAHADVAEQNFNVELQRVTPIPNLDLYAAIQHDDTNSRNDVSYNLRVGIPLPLFDRNQGNIAAAHAELVRSQHNWINTQNDLSARLAEIIARYATARELAATYRTDIVPSQVQTFRGVYTQFREVGGEIDFAQVIVSQQTLSQVVEQYLDTLAAQWDAAVDLSEILQVEDIYTMDGIVVPPMVEPAP
jgi:cobalt-zinc-cadmium efflux system outer membrane protein